MTEILDLAVEFAKKIQKTQEYLKLEEAKKNNDNDRELLKMIEKYNSLIEKVKILVSKNDSKKEEIDKTNEEIALVYEKIMKNENMNNFNLASEKVNILMNKINSILIDAVNGKEISAINFDENNTCSKNEDFGCGSCKKCFGKK